MSRLDWSQAPEGATHCNVAKGAASRDPYHWNRLVRGEWFFFDPYEERWERTPFPFPEEQDELVSRPEPYSAGPSFEIVSNEPAGRPDAWLVLEAGRVVGEFAWYDLAEEFLSELVRKKGLQK